MPKFLLIITQLLLFQLCTAQSLEQELDSLFKAYQKEKNFMGRVSIDTTGQTIYSKGIGYANINNRTHSDSNTRYAIGSITKTYIATLILLKAEEGKLNLSDKLSQYQPEIPFADRISIEDLLKHNSGITDKAFFNWKYRSKPLKLSKGPQYANANYGLLGEILEQLEGKTLKDILQEQIFSPVDLNKTSFGIEDSNKHLLATAYRQKQNEWKPEPFHDLMVAGGAGGIASTPEDVNSFFHQLFSGKIISDSSIQLMSNFESGYAMGLFPAVFIQEKGYSNSGQFASYHSTVVYFPKEQLAITICSNGLDRSLNSMLKDIMLIYHKHNKIAQ